MLHYVFLKASLQLPLLKKTSTLKHRKQSRECQFLALIKILRSMKPNSSREEILLILMGLFQKNYLIMIKKKICPAMEK